MNIHRFNDYAGSYVKFLTWAEWLSQRKESFQIYIFFLFHLWNSWIVKVKCKMRKITEHRFTLLYMCIGYTFMINTLLRFRMYVCICIMWTGHTYDCEAGFIYNTHVNGTSTGYSHVYVFTTSFSLKRHLHWRTRFHT